MCILNRQWTTNAPSGFHHVRQHLRHLQHFNFAWKLLHPKKKSNVDQSVARSSGHPTAFLPCLAFITLAANPSELQDHLFNKILLHNMTSGWTLAVERAENKLPPIAHKMNQSSIQRNCRLLYQGHILFQYSNLPIMTPSLHIPTLN